MKTYKKLILSILLTQLLFSPGKEVLSQNWPKIYGNSISAYGSMYWKIMRKVS